MSRPFDVLVVGGGRAGCVLASRLSEDPDGDVDRAAGFVLAASSMLMQPEWR